MSAVDPRVQPDALPLVRVKRFAGCRNEAWGGQDQGVWIDVEHPDASTLSDLSKVLKFNRLALEDALEPEHWTRFEAYPEHLFLVFRSLADPEAVTERTEHLSLFYYPQRDLVLTLRLEPITYLDGVWVELERRSQSSATELIYALLMQGTDTFFDFLDAFELETDRLEEEVFKPRMTARMAGEFSSQVFALKHTLMVARRLVSGAREASAQFSRSLPPEAALYVRDVADHLSRVYDGIDSEREVLSSLLDVHLSVQSYRMNEVMKTLTTVSTVFLPLTFLAGVWGMNFHWMPELSEPLGYALAWVVFVLVALGLGAYFRRRGWW